MYAIANHQITSFCIDFVVNDSDVVEWVMSWVAVLVKVVWTHPVISVLLTVLVSKQICYSTFKLVQSVHVACDDWGGPCAQLFLLLKFVWETRWKEFAVNYLLEIDIFPRKFLDKTWVVTNWTEKQTYDLRYRNVIVNITKSLRFLRIPW